MELRAQELKHGRVAMLAVIGWFHVAGGFHIIGDYVPWRVGGGRGSCEGWSGVRIGRHPY